MGRNSHGRSVWRTAGIVVGGVLIVGVVVAAGVVGRFAWRNLDGWERRADEVARAGFVEKRATVDGVTFTYAEGPDGPDRPALLIVPGQGSDWKSFAKVLPDLARDFHVFAVDVHGHGGTDRTPSRYRARLVGADLAAFVEQVVGEPVIVSGHSSGGQIAAWLGANAKPLVRGVVLEDPPMFTTLLPRARHTYNWNDLATACHGFLARHPEGSGDFVAWSWEHQLMWSYFGEVGPRLRRAGLDERAAHPDRPLRLWWWPGNDYNRSLERYDPRFGDAFWTGAWDEGFDHEATLRAITAPTVYLHAKVDHDENGILRGAASDEDAARIRSLLPNASFVQTDTGHDIHNENPESFLAALAEVRSLMVGRF